MSIFENNLLGRQPRRRNFSPCKKGMALKLFISGNNNFKKFEVKL